MATVNPFQINVSQSVLDDLSSRIRHTRWPETGEDAGWAYGTDPRYLKELLTYWDENYDWRKQEEELNKYPQFTTAIDGIAIHFVQAKGKNKNSRPLLLIHGWPDSFYRFHKIISMLNEGEHSFDLVIPSIPGFGFSGHRAVNSDVTAGIFHRLMTDTLGYEQYFIAGGDMGSVIAKSMANQFPGEVKAIHITDVGYPTGQEDWSVMTPAEQEFGQMIQHWFFTEGAFNMIQATKPQSLSYGLNDSPAGLAGWIIEKFNSWSDNNGNIENSFSKDELLTNIMIYWVSQTIDSSVKTYAENARAAYTGGLKSSQKVTVPTGVSLFPGEAQFPKEWAERMVNLVSYKKLDKGGHFAPMELPYVYAVELSDFFSAIDK
ncbi:MAG: epoxide hydrolase [Terrimonas ferruginea]|uniref:epoxide hydrolase family protein n=1 Tax=Terrimonas ferruginea TaxID=249 RepID=UPI000927C330|nr:epoxide hydrolase family protein [Terrimonas ferruginea]MBN8784314.1 epoxide hydrolase [Terrimonas ferruginea]OJW45754.1 MAG: multidrug MFS transporter [Sphingobacteriales bacterium 48-107]